MSSFTSKATGQWEAEGATTWNEAGHPQAGDDVTIQNTHVVTQTQNEACAGLIVDSGGELDMVTFNLANSSTTTVNGTLIIGVSAGTGLTTAGLTESGGALTLLASSKINNSGNLSLASALTTNTTGIYTQTGVASTWAKGASILFAQTILNSAITITGAFTYIGNGTPSPTNLEINSTIDVNGNHLYLGVSSGGTWAIGASGQINGAGTIHFRPQNHTFTFTNSYTGTHGFSGTIQSNANASSAVVIDGDWRNATVNCVSKASGTVLIKSGLGTLSANILQFTYSAAVSTAMTVSNVENVNLVVYGSIDFDATGTGPINYTKGAGTITLANSATKTADFDGKAVEDIVKSGAGTTQIVGDFSADSLSGSAGTIESDTPATQRVITVASTGVASGVTFKDISMGSANRVNAKGGTNNGNNKGIVFRDKLIVG